MDSAGCDSSLCLNTAEKTLCSNRGQCIGGVPGTGACTDCSLKAAESSASTDCSISSPYGPPPDLAQQVDQLSRQLNVPVLISQAARYLPETMEMMDQVVETEIRRVGSSGKEDFVAPNVLLFLDEPNSTYSGLRFGVGSALLGYIPDISNPAQIKLDTTPTFNYYLAPLPLSTMPGTAHDYTRVIDMADAQGSNSLLGVQFVFRQSELSHYMINADVAESMALYEKYWVPSGERDNPWTGWFRPFMPQGAFFRPVRSDNQTRMLAAYAATTRPNATGAGVFFNMQGSFKPPWLAQGAKTFGAPGTNKQAVTSMEFQPSAPILSRYVLPGVFRMKLTSQSSMWYIPMTSWKINVFVAGESPLLVNKGLEASPPGFGSTQTNRYGRTNVLMPIAPVDAVNNQSLSYHDIEKIFDYDAAPVRIETCGNVATLLYLKNGSARVIYSRDATTHEYAASGVRRGMFEKLFLRAGTQNASAMPMKCASFGDDFVLYAPGNMTIWAFGRNTHNRFSHWSYSMVNETFEGEELFYARRNAFGDIFVYVDGSPQKPWQDWASSEYNDTIADIALSGEFMIVRTTGTNNNVYFAGNSEFGETRYACCAIRNAIFLTKISLGTNSIQVLEVHVGIGFSVYMVRARGGTKNYLIGCGQEGTITPPFGATPPFPTPLTFREIRSSEPKKVCTGHYHGCIMASSGKMTCWGYLRTNRFLRMCGGSSGPNYNTETPAFAEGTDISCGHSHVVVKRWEGTNRYDGTELQSWSICGSADKGQIGAGYQLSSEEPDANSRPIFAAPQRIFLAKTSDNSNTANLIPPVMETYNMVAQNDFTIAFTRPRRHASIDHMIMNWVSNAGRPPPNGMHYMHPSFGDEGPFYIDFTSLPGVPLLVVANQSASSDPWLYMPTNSSTKFPDPRFDFVFKTSTTTAGTATTQLPPLNETGHYVLWAPDSLTSPTNPMVYFKNWTKLLKNVTTATQFGSTPLYTEVIATMFVPHLLLLTSKGEVFRLGVDALPCNGEPWKANMEYWDQVKAWCDAKNMGRGLWKTRDATGSYTDPLAGGDLEWVALTLRLRVTTFNRVLRSVGYTSLLNGTSVFFASQPSVPYFFNQFVPLRWSGPPCTTLASPLDCGGAVFFEAYMERQVPQIVTRTTIFSFPTGGVQLMVLNISTNFQHAIEMTPLIYGVDVTQTAGGNPGLRGTSQNYLGLMNICFFMKVGVRYYWIMLRNDFRYLLCDTGPRAPGATVPGALPQYSADFNRIWEFPIPGVLRLRHLDNFYSSNYDPLYEINDLYFKVECSGGLLTKLGANNTIEWTNHSAFVIFSNETIDELFAADPYWWFKDTYNTKAANSAALSDRIIGPYGCAGGLVVPIQPMVEATQFHTFVQTERPIQAEDEIVIAIMSPQFSALHVKYFFVIGKNGPRVERIVDTATWVKSRINAGRVDATVCKRIPLRTYKGHWNSFSLIHNITTGKTELWWNSKLACSPGNWFGFGAGQAFTVSGIYVGVRNRDMPFTAVARFRELVLCDARTAGYKMFGCVAGLYPYEEVGVTSSVSTSLSFTYMMSESRSLITRETVSESDSITVSVSSTGNLSESVTLSKSGGGVSETQPSGTLSVSIQETLSNTSSFSDSESGSHIHIHRLHLLEFNEDIVTSNLIRRTGLLLRFYVQGDLWNPYSDWDTKPAGYLRFDTNLDELDNPNAMGFTYKVDGVLTAIVRAENWSILQVQLGPSGHYNSGRDEVLVFSPRESGVASHILPPNNITIKIRGGGFFVQTSDIVVELLACAGVLLNLLVVGAPSLVLRFSSNMVLTNFQCYNNENFPTTFLFNPIPFRVGGSRNLGMMLCNLGIILGIFAVWVIGMVVVKRVHKKGGWHKIMGAAGWPTLPILLSLIFLPGLMFGAWRTAFESDSAKMYFIPLGVMVLIFIPLVYLYTNIMDDANFLAQWEPRDPQVLEVRAKKYPMWSKFQIPGQWISLDNHGSFVAEMRWFFYECTEERKYFILYELCVLLMETFICSITNTKYSFCTIQMLVVALMRMCLFVASIRLKPRSAPAHHYIMTVIYAGQAAMAIIVAAYAAQQLTNSMRAFVGFMLIGSSFTISVLSIVAFVGSAHERLLEAVFFRVLKRESDMTARAPPHKERTVNDIILEAEENDDDGKDDNNDEAEDRNSGEMGAHDGFFENDGKMMMSPKKAATLLGINDGSLTSGNNERNSGDSAEDEELKEISSISRGGGKSGAAAAAAAGSVSPGWMSPFREPPPEEDEEEKAARLQAEAEAEVKRKAEADARRRESRNVWKLIAQEEAQDKPTKTFLESDEL